MSTDSTDRNVDYPSEQAKADYRHLLESYRDSKSKDPIANRFPWQAKLALRALAQLAQERQEAKQQGDEPEEVLIVSSALPELFFGGETGEALQDFHKAGGRIKVLVWNDAESVRPIRDPFWQSLAKDSDSFRVSGTSKLGDELNHFFVVGRDAFRLEAPHPDHGDTEITDFAPEVPARICFNDPGRGENIVRYFQTLWDFSSPESCPAD